jgi:hypothetical protein
MKLNLLSLWLVSFLVGLRTYQHPCNIMHISHTHILQRKTRKRREKFSYSITVGVQSDLLQQCRLDVCRHRTWSCARNLDSLSFFPLSFNFPRRVWVRLLTLDFQMASKKEVSGCKVLWMGEGVHKTFWNQTILKILFKLSVASRTLLLKPKVAFIRCQHWLVYVTISCSLWRAPYTLKGPIHPKGPHTL